MNRTLLTLAAAAAVLTGCRSERPVAGDDITVACYYFPNYHTGDPLNELNKGEGWSEWKLVREAQPRFEGHDQPKVPLWGYTDEKDPAVMARKIEAAASHGIDVMLFDWYRYDSVPFLNRCLDEGFLKAPNVNDIRFGLMWANHDWVEIHPATHGEPQKLLYPGKVSPEAFETIGDELVRDYFTRPNYWLIDGKAYFYHAIGTDDDEKEFFNHGNALLGAFDAAGNLLWSWHLWCAEFDPADEQVELGGEVMMKRNLGAGVVSGTSEEDILASYGVYYQWGRKDPFVGPRYYNMADSADAQVYDSQNLRVYPEYAATDAERGSAGYASAHAMTFITGTKESGYNWLQTADASLWGTEKNNNDPCPKGWKVPSKEVFAALHIKDVISPELEKNYGFTLSDGTNEAFFPGAGRRSFYTGALTNMNDNEVRPTPWTGYYWSSTGEGKEAYAMDFSFDINGTRAGSSFQGAALQYAAGGMQVRCVKIR